MQDENEFNLTNALETPAARRNNLPNDWFSIRPLPTLPTPPPSRPTCIFFRWLSIGSLSCGWQSSGDSGSLASGPSPGAGDPPPLRLGVAAVAVAKHGDGFLEFPDGRTTS